MTIDKTLKRRGRLVRSRNVLRRAERIEKLEFDEQWTAGKNSPFGLPKVRVLKTVIGKKKKKKAKEEEEDTGEAPAEKTE